MSKDNLKGKFLISAPFLNDVFKRSVILITENNDKGSVGFIINKPSKYYMHEVVDDFPVFESKVMIGGPVDVQFLNFIHKAGDIFDGGHEIDKGIFWNGNYESLKILAGNNSLDPGDFRFFLGYAGWDAGQLEEELKTNSWFIAEADPDSIFSTEPEKLWSSILKKMGGEYKIISSFPDDPSVN
jgi:putative transcriptional regulator